MYCDILTRLEIHLNEEILAFTTKKWNKIIKDFNGLFLGFIKLYIVNKELS
jgi:hypothetical protein